MKLDAKTIAAIAAAFSTVVGAVELRVKVGEIDSRLSRIERVVDSSPHGHSPVATNDVKSEPEAR